MPAKHSQHTLRKRFKALTTASVCAVILFSFMGFWRIQLFNDKLFVLRESSHQLESALQENFDNTKLVGDIHTNIRLYMQSAEPALLTKIRHDADDLSAYLPEKFDVNLKHFLEMVDVLEVRMKSLRENSQKVYQSEQNIMRVNRTLLDSVDRSYFFMIQPLTSKSCLKHHNLYVSSLLTGQVDTLKHIQAETTDFFKELYEKLGNLVEELPREKQKQLARELTGTYYELEDAVSTITAIRLTALSTRIELEKELDSIGEEIAEYSLSQNSAATLLVSEGLGLAKDNFSLLLLSLIGVTFLFSGIAYYLNSNMVAPLISFVELLKKTAHVLVGIRKQRVEEDETFQALNLISTERKDEIGEMAGAVKSLIVRMKDLFIFRQGIEADESPSEIYERLARICSEKFGLEKLVIYEKSPDSESLEVVLVQPPEMADELPSLREANVCRANRTGNVISSLDDAHACPLFPFRDVLDHVCVPMLVGGNVIGVMEFLFPLDLQVAERTKIRSNIEEATYFIAEALPVLQSKHLANKLQEIAVEDQLTGLYNRRYLSEVLPQLSASVIRRESKVGILLCDLDVFKEINDNHGHDAGDAVLSQFARVLTNCVRKTDLVIRFGGEEFLILLMDCDAEKAMAMGEKVRRTVESYRFHTGRANLQKTLSIGVTEFPTAENTDIQEAIRYADLALYKAKQGGRNQVVFYEHSMEQEALK